MEEILDPRAAARMGIDQIGQVRWQTTTAKKGSAIYTDRQRQTADRPHQTPKKPTQPAWKVCIMIHSGSRGLGHQVATDALVEMEKAMARDGIHTNDRQLACARINSKVRPCVGVWAVGKRSCGGAYA